MCLTINREKNTISTQYSVHHSLSHGRFYGENAKGECKNGKSF